MHLGVALVHGAAHSGARIPMSPLANLFVLFVILAGPPAGIALSWRAERPGALLVAGTMAGALLFGVVNHFVLAGADHVAHVAAQWRVLFGTTAALLAVTEMAGLGFALRLIAGRSR